MKEYRKQISFENSYFTWFFLCYKKILNMDIIDIRYCGHLTLSLSFFPFLCFETSSTLIKSKTLYIWIFTSSKYSRKALYTIHYFSIIIIYCHFSLRKYQIKFHLLTHSRFTLWTNRNRITVTRKKVYFSWKFCFNVM